MQGDDIREQIEALRQEVRGLSTSILNLRQDDMRKVFGDQIRPVLIDRISRHYAHAIKRTEEASKEELHDLVDRAIAIFQGEGKLKALGFIKDIEEEIAGKTSKSDDENNRFELEIITQLEEYFLLSDTVFNQTVPEMHVMLGRTAPVKDELSPVTVEKLLSPLSNAKRVQVLMILKRESNSLAELSKELALKKGHLQFHLKALIEVDYIQFDRKSRLYALTARGKIAMEGIATLVDNIQTANIRTG